MGEGGKYLRNKKRRKAGYIIGQEKRVRRPFKESGLLEGGLRGTGTGWLQLGGRGTNPKGEKPEGFGPLGVRWDGGGDFGSLGTNGGGGWRQPTQSIWG